MLSRDRNIYIAKSDNGSGVVLLNKAGYNQKVSDIINGRDKFEEIHGEITYKIRI